MTDIDFDELDRAVSSLMDQHSNQDADRGATPSFDDSASRSDSTPVTNRSDVVASTSESSAMSSGASTSSATTDTIVSSTPTPVTAPIQRRAGRVIMDVVPPTNRTSPARPMATKSPSREGAAIAPAEDGARGYEMSNTPVQEPTPSADLDLNLVAGVPLDDVPVQPESDFVSPLKSPFIEGVSVDKRPLGQRIPDEELAEKLQFDQPEPVADTMPDPISFEAERNDVASDSPVEDIHSHVMSNDPWSSEGETDNTLTEAPLRPELQPDILAVESASIPDPTTPVAPTANVAPKPAPEAPTPVSPVVSGAKDIGPSTPGDIRPQYTAEPSDAPEPSGIFEAAVNAPQPLKHPEKKRSGWLAVVWILLLVVLGAGGGAIAWYFLLQ